MKNHHSSHTTDLTTLAKDARELLTATVDIAGEKVGEARKRVASALERVKEGAQATDKAVRQHPYKTLAIAGGAGLLLGFLFASRSSKKQN